MGADFLHVNLISNEKVSDFDMPCALTAQGLPILLQEKSALVILQQQVLNNSIAL
jgi:hypothetical protein